MNAYDYDSPLWRPARCDDDGRLDVIVNKGSITPVQADGATQIAKHDSVNNGVSTVHQVTADKNFHFVSWIISTDNSGGAASSTRLSITNAANNLQYYILYAYTLQNTVLNMSHSFSIPLIIPAPYKIRIEAPIASFTIHCTIYGYEI